MTPLISNPTREQVKNFMKFIKDENRYFDLKKTLDEIIINAMNGVYNKQEELDKLKLPRAQTADLANILSSNQEKLLAAIEQL
jgi:hypothetical protein